MQSYFPIHSLCSLGSFAAQGSFLSWVVIQPAPWESCRGQHSAREKGCHLERLRATALNVPILPGRSLAQEDKAQQSVPTFTQNTALLGGGLTPTACLAQVLQ